MMEDVHRGNGVIAAAPSWEVSFWEFGAPAHHSPVPAAPTADLLSDPLSAPPVNGERSHREHLYSPNDTTTEHMRITFKP